MSIFYLPVDPETGDELVTGELIKKVNDYLLTLLAEKESRFTANELMFIFSVLPYTQAELAFAMGRDKSTLTYYKNGKNAPDVSFCRTLQEVIRGYLNDSDEEFSHLQKMAAAEVGVEMLAGLKRPVRLG